MGASLLNQRLLLEEPYEADPLLQVAAPGPIRSSETVWAARTKFKHGRGSLSLPLVMTCRISGSLPVPILIWGQLGGSLALGAFSGPGTASRRKKIIERYERPSEEGANINGRNEQPSV